MSGRFPPDLFTIIVVPFIAFALGVFVPILLIPAHVHHQLALLVVASIIGAVVVLAAAAVVRRHRHK